MTVAATTVSVSHSSPFSASSLSKAVHRSRASVTEGDLQEVKDPGVEGPPVRSSLVGHPFG
ncbi:hypothetical protein CGL27_28130 [Streptomyces sp. 11-1-2]|nr:hypothetical protein CGL27_28130 [Streptomyces sp. 11-1-2]